MLPDIKSASFLYNPFLLCLYKRLRPWSGFGSRTLTENGIYGVIGWFRNTRFRSLNS